MGMALRARGPGRSPSEAYARAGMVSHVRSRVSFRSVLFVMLVWLRLCISRFSSSRLLSAYSSSALAISPAVTLSLVLISATYRLMLSRYARRPLYDTVLRTHDLVGLISVGSCTLVYSIWFIPPFCHRIFWVAPALSCLKQTRERLVRSTWIRSRASYSSWQYGAQASEG